MYRGDLQKFLEMVGVELAVDDVLKQIDTDIADGKITVNEWMDYLTERHVNPDIDDIRQLIESNTTLCSALRIFGKLDQDHSGKLEYAEFVPFGDCMGLNAEETEVLWHQMDEDDSGAIDIVELLKWFRMRMYKQSQRQMKQQKSTPRITEDVDTDDVGTHDEDSACESEREDTIPIGDENDEIAVAVNTKALKISDSERGSDSISGNEQTPGGNVEDINEDEKQKDMPITGKSIDNYTHLQILEEDKSQEITQESLPEPPIAVNDPEQVERQESIISNRSFSTGIDKEEEEQETMESLDCGDRETLKLNVVDDDHVDDDHGDHDIELID